MFQFPRWVLRMVKRVDDTGDMGGTATKTANAAPLQVVCFRVGAEEYALDIGAVQEIREMVPITRVPRTPPYITGVFNLRGRIAPVVDLKMRLAFGRSALTPETRIIVVEDDERQVGVIVDEVTETLDIDPEAVETLAGSTIGAPGAAGAGLEYVDGVAKHDDRLVILLNLDGILRGGRSEVGRENREP